ncbi:uncharacterized protein LOC133323891, partial [Musca vetustissima]|uniref:uncharacterized protein LOC133323891 n=1 Tax=Musca vetustissima TaxID=27455 RepID=UPI002AB6266D
MEFWLKLLLTLSSCPLPVNGFSLTNFHLEEPLDNNYYQKIMEEIVQEQTVESLLIVHQNSTLNGRLRIFHESAIPKIIISRPEDFLFVENFNMELLTIFLMREKFNSDLMAIGAKILDYRHQTRIFIVAENISGGVGAGAEEEFKNQLLMELENYKMTNVLLNFLEDKPGPNNTTLYALRPYPRYHWIIKPQSEKYYPPYWRNMANTTLTTLIGQDPVTGLAYYDSNGNLQMNGQVARLIMLYAERYNASLKMHRSFKFGKITPYIQLNEMSLRGELDVPMSLSLHTNLSQTPLLRTGYYEMIKSYLMVPCPTQLNNRELIALLLNGYFLGCVLVFSLIFSIFHSLIDYYLDNLWDALNFLLNDHILPGILGQSFLTRSSPWRSLKIVYLLVSFIGLNIAVQFSAQFSTLFTDPSYHKAIETIKDLQKSPLKIFTDHANGKGLIPIFGKDK